MGYLAATLAEYGHPIELVEFRDSPESILSRIRTTEPVVVGFSLIFQYYLPEYRDLIQKLRAAGVDAHFTMGGHYPSLCPEEVLTSVPELDSVALFEGELTIVELTAALRAGDDWRQVPGLAYLRDAEIIESRPRVLIENLDDLPLPLRLREPERVLGWPTLPLLASRGCARRCSFCSIHTFYRGAPGRTVRVRSAAKVAEEMEILAERHGVRIFLFQDDDFPLAGRPGKRWVAELAEEIQRRGIAERCIWKVSCRAEYIEPELFAMLRQAGLYLVYMGLESGSEEGLEILNKRISVETNSRAVHTLKNLGLLVEYGFMLFDPSSTFESVRTNIGFLRSILRDGSGGAVFCRMLPYGGTPIRDRLRDEGRLRGDVKRPDYDFLDLRLNRYHELLNGAVAPWIHGSGLSHQLNWAWHEVFIIRRLVGELPGLQTFEQDLAELANRSNGVIFNFVEETSVAFEAGDHRPLLRNDLGKQRRDLGDALVDLRNGFILQNQSALMDALTAHDGIFGPALMPQVF
jgi:anaerobic magnesium-protoporphyrin IX monomethyl ester cyclase